MAKHNYTTPATAPSSPAPSLPRPPRSPAAKRLRHIPAGTPRGGLKALLGVFAPLRDTDLLPVRGRPQRPPPAETRERLLCCSGPSAHEKIRPG